MKTALVCLVMKKSLSFDIYLLGLLFWHKVDLTGHSTLIGLILSCLMS